MTTPTKTAVRLTPVTQHRYGSLGGEVPWALRQRFPARQTVSDWPSTVVGRQAVIDRIDEPALRAESPSAQGIRRRSADKLLRWLECFPGDTWQRRWLASPAHGLGDCWIEEPISWLTSREEFADRRHLRAGLLAMFCADVIRPDLEWLLRTCRSRHWRNAIAAHRDSDGFAQLQAQAGPKMWSSNQGFWARNQIAILLIAKGGTVADITVGDCLELKEAETRAVVGSSGRTLFYSLLKSLGTFPDDAPSTLRGLAKHSGQVSVEQLVDRYELQCRPVRDLLVDYLAERQPVLDYGSLVELSRALALHFWKNVEALEPGIDSLRLAPQTAKALKERLRTKVVRRRMPDGTVADIASPRKDSSYVKLLISIRGFYLDLAHWALEDPGRWGPWAAPCPIGAAEISNKKNLTRTKARMDQRTRERLPALPALVKAAEQHLTDAKERLEVLRSTRGGHTFTVLGQTLRKAISADRDDSDGSNCAFDDDGRRIDLAKAEHRAFWGWAAVEFLRNTGVRIEEMLESSHHSITKYKLPSTGELIPLLQIAPSKTDQERLLVVSPELADVLSTIVCRVRQPNGAILSVPSYDQIERTWNPPMPLLFQWSVNGEPRNISAGSIRRAINEILAYSGLTDATGQPLHFQPHDFRRIFTTEAILNGMPPHIAQLILGHKDINTTMAYKAVYPQEAIDGHRAFIARRRSLRPSEEYRTPTDEEWEEFLGHFERRKVSLGDCGRAYGTACAHEHSCVKCPLLRVDPTERQRLVEIRDNLTVRVQEAEREGWREEAEGLQVSLAAAGEKLAQLDARTRRATTVHLGIPTFHEVAGRTATLPRAPT